MTHELLFESLPKEMRVGICLVRPLRLIMVACRVCGHFTRHDPALDLRDNWYTIDGFVRHHNETCRPVVDTILNGYCHLAAPSRDALHSFAALIGVGSHWYHNKVTNRKPNGTRNRPHYDLSPSARHYAVANGAREVPRFADGNVAECLKGWYG